MRTRFFFLAFTDFRLLCHRNIPKSIFTHATLQYVELTFYDFYSKMSLDDVKHIVLVSTSSAPLYPSRVAKLTALKGPLRQRRRWQILHNHPARPLPLSSREISRHSRHRPHWPLHPTLPRPRKRKDNPSARWLAAMRSTQLAASGPLTYPYPTKRRR